MRYEGTPREGQPRIFLPRRPQLYGQPHFAPQFVIIWLIPKRQKFALRQTKFRTSLRADTIINTRNKLQASPSKYFIS